MKKPIKPKPVKKPSVWADLYNRLQAGDKEKRRIVLSELQSKFRASDENALADKIMKLVSCEIKTHQINADRADAPFLINMRYEDRTKKPLYGHQYPAVYVIKNWHSLTDGVILSYLQLCKQLGRYI